MKVTKNNGTANKKFLEITSEARSKVEKWPEWKRAVRVTKYSVGFEGKSETK